MPKTGTSLRHLNSQQKIIPTIFIFLKVCRTNFAEDVPVIFQQTAWTSLQLLYFFEFNCLISRINIKSMLRLENVYKLFVFLFTGIIAQHI